MKRLCMSLMFLSAIILSGCALRSLDYTVTTTQPDGVVEVRHIKARINSLAYDNTVSGFEWSATASNTTVRLDRHSSTGGATNIAKVCEASGKWADAVRSLAQ